MARSISGGFQPVPSLDGFPVACGNNGKASLIFADGTIKDLGEVGAPSGWLGRELALSRGAILPGGGYGRRLVFLNIDTGVERDSGIDPAQNPGYWPQIACKAGRIVSSIPGQHFLDGQPIATEDGAGQIEDFDGIHILFPVFLNGQYTFVVRNIVIGVDVLRVPKKLENARIDLLSDGVWLSWNEGGKMQVLAPNGDGFSGPGGEGRGLLFEHEGLRYIVTITNHGWDPIWIVRLFSDWSVDGPAWVLGIGFDGMQYAAGQGMGYVNDGTGRLIIEPIPFGTPLRPYVRPVQPPEVVPIYFPAVITDIRIPRPTLTLPECWFGGWAGDAGPPVPGNMQCSQYFDDDLRAVLEQICRWPIPLTVPLLAGYLGSDDGGDYTSQEIDEIGKRNDARKAAGLIPDGRAIHIHVDDIRHEDRMLRVRERVIAAGLTAVMGIHAAGDPIEQLEKQVLEYLKLGQWGQIRSYHFGWDSKKYWRDPAYMLAYQAEVTELRRRLRAILDALFGWDRPGGRLQCEELAFYAHDLAKLTKRPARLIGEPEPIVIVQPPVVVKPKPRPWGNADTPVIKKPGKRGTWG